jgi:hypothetical protein
VLCITIFDSCDTTSTVLRTAGPVQCMQSPASVRNFSGFATYYDDAGFTACGERVPSDGDYAAISFPQSRALDSSQACSSNPNRCSWCNKKVTVKGSAGTQVVRLLDQVRTHPLDASSTFDNREVAKIRPDGQGPTGNIEAH